MTYHCIAMAARVRGPMTTLHRNPLFLKSSSSALANIITYYFDGTQDAVLPGRLKVHEETVMRVLWTKQWKPHTQNSGCIHTTR